MSSPLVPEVRVVAAVVRRGDRLLVARRPVGKRHAGLWEFPGGKVQAGESDFEALDRELGEEPGVGVVEIGRQLHVARDPCTPFLVVFLECRLAGEPVALEHDALTRATVSELRALPLAPTDRGFVESLAPAGQLPTDSEA